MGQKDSVLGSVRSTTMWMENGYSRTNSDVSFAGFTLFDQVRRNFEFGPNRAPFYPPANTSSKADVSSSLNDAAYFFTDSSEVEVARRCEAVDSPFSMVSVSSYGREKVTLHP